MRVASDDPDHGGFIVINEADFSPELHKKWVKPTRVPRVKKAAESEAGAPEVEDGAD